MHGTISLKEYICILSQIFTTLAVSTTDRRNGLGGREGGREGGRSQYELPVPGHLEGSPESDYNAYVFVFLGTSVICRFTD